MTKLVYLIRFVADMSEAIAFHRDKLGLQLKFQSPIWTEFSTGETTLALHPASEKNPAGTSLPGFRVADLDALYAERESMGLTFTCEPSLQHGVLVAYIVDQDGAVSRVSALPPK
ncbi:MAG: VOC family protein [Alphaproteobacteria bacterium]